MPQTSVTRYVGANADLTQDRCRLHRGGEIVQETARPCRPENPDQRSSTQFPFTQEGSMITVITDSNLQLSSGRKQPVKKENLNIK
jgi:hypothetical protein